MSKDKYLSIFFSSELEAFALIIHQIFSTTHGSFEKICEYHSVNSPILAGRIQSRDTLKPMQCMHCMQAKIFLMD